MARAELCPSPSQQRWARDGQSFIPLLPPKACLASRSRLVVQSMDLTSAKPNQCSRNGTLQFGKEDPKSVLLFVQQSGDRRADNISPPSPLN